MRVSSATLAAALLLADRSLAFRAPVPQRRRRARPSTSTDLGALPNPLDAAAAPSLDALSGALPTLPSLDALSASLPPLPSSPDRLLADLSSLSSELVETFRLSTPEQLATALNDDLLPTLLSGPWEVYALASLFALGGLLLAVASTPDDFASDGAPYPSGTDTYDPVAASEFYARRPALVLKRLVKLSTLTAGFNAGLLFDWLILGKLCGDEEFRALRRNEPRRAREALDLCTKLGPTFIKLGQVSLLLPSLSRMSSSYVVRRRPSSVARAILAERRGD